MTTTTMPPRRTSALPAGGATLPRVLRSEWTKFWSLRSTWWTLLIAFVVTVGFSTLLAWGASSNVDKMDAHDRATLDVTNAAMVGIAFGQLALAVLGALIIAGEYSTGGVKTTFVAVPNRLRVLLAKVLVFGVVAWVVGTVSAFVSFFVAMSFWSSHDLAASLSDPGVLRAVLGAGLIALAAGLLGLALGALIRHTAGSITTAVALLFVVPPLTGLLPGDWGNSISKHFTTNAGQRITEVIHTPGQLGPWAGYLWMLAECVIPLIVGAWLMRRRDA
ncbi:ABC transporter permease subunit [Actinoplanes sp. NPDC051343]|uniref:ABC transporter permease subunit n=1 Tax=Actinoplanes sp. NPDC051343 TaxID=3363906 RepID=UPI0037AF2B09